MDTHEASVWETGDAALIAKIQDGTVTLADLTDKGAVQHGVKSDDYGAGCPDTGNGCVDFYAVSIPAVTPSRFLTWFQAAAAARNAGKRLPSNAEWQAAALGTPDPGESVAGSEDCNTGRGIDPFTGVQPVNSLVASGSRDNCVSDVGAFDLVGNLNEWVADWVLGSTCAQIVDGEFNGLCAVAFIRGGGCLDFNFGTYAGVFAVEERIGPWRAFSGIGFRAAR